MRTYYIFRINSELIPLYERKSTNIYKILNRINSFNKKEYRLAKKIYSRIIVPLNKKKIDNYILMNHMNDLYYTKNLNRHELLSTFEESRLYIHNTYIKIITTNNISTFFKDIYSINNNYFVIDFNNKDYFYLDDLKVKLLAE